MSTFLLTLGGLFAATEVQQSSGPRHSLRQEEATAYYEKWLKQDVVYIITDEERAVFGQLNNAEEKEQFIEQFWFRRDSDPRTAANEFKEEHYRRIAYANERFTSGEPGWRTDRGRVYIIHGPPDSIVSRPDGGSYLRPTEEGGGITNVHPFEKWRYRFIEGIGPDVELEFVDSTQTGAYKLAVYAWEKDALLRSGGGQTLAEETGLSTRTDHPALTPGAGGAGYGAESWYRRSRDTPFARYELLAKVGAAPAEKYRDLESLVRVDIQYAALPFEVRESYFRLNETQALVPITIQVAHKDLHFQLDQGVALARVALYGTVSTLSQRRVQEFGDDFVVERRPEDLGKQPKKSSVYQKVLVLDLHNRYKLDLVLKDLNAGKLGTFRSAVTPPDFRKTSLLGSSLLLSDRIQPLETVPSKDEMFVLGDVRILPRLDQRYTNAMPLGVYFQIYNAELDQSTLEPSLRVTYSLLQKGQQQQAAVDENGESTQFSSPRRIVLVKRLSLSGLAPGSYQILVEVVDRITGRTLQRLGEFVVVDHL